MQLSYTLQRVSVDVARRLCARPCPLSHLPINPDAAYVFHGTLSWRQTPGTFGGAMVELRHVAGNGNLKFRDAVVHLDCPEVPHWTGWRDAASRLRPDEDLVLVLKIHPEGRHAAVRH